MNSSLDRRDKRVGRIFAAREPVRMPPRLRLPHLARKAVMRVRDRGVARD